MHLLVLFLTINHQCMDMNHLKLPVLLGSDLSSLSDTRVIISFVSM